MTTGEKIRYFRIKRGLSQEELARQAGISVNSIRKYEKNGRVPKMDAISKLADTLHTSVASLVDISLESIDEMAPYLFEIGRKGGIIFEGEKDENGMYKPASVKIRFQDYALNEFLSKWASYIGLTESLRSQAADTEDEQAKEYLLKRAEEIEQEFEYDLTNNPRTVDYRSDSIAVKLHNTSENL